MKQKMFWVKWLSFLVLALAQSWAAAQDFDFRAPPGAADASVPAVMRDLAVRVLPVYQEKNPERYLSTLSALQMVAGNYSSAYSTRQSLRERRPDAVRPMVYDIYIRARAIEAESRIPFAQAFTLSFRNVVPRIADHEAYALAGWFNTPLAPLQDALQRAFEQRRSKNSISLAEAVDLIWTYFAFDAYRSFGSLVAALNAEEDRRRYIFEENTVKTRDGASIATLLIRPKTLDRLPTLLEFTIYDSQGYAKEAAARGYVGAVAYSRGVHGSPDKVAPFERDGDDAHAVIEWIARQPWSDGQVGMYGTNYSGFAAWAAARRQSPALKAIATTDAIAPGIDVPMIGNIFRNGTYRWALQLSGTKPPGDKKLDDEAQWRAFNLEWYSGGRSYRELAMASGNHNPLFDAWLSHPSYDRYWQRMTPYREQFARIDIPVLTTTGYFADGEVGAMHYFTQHHRYNPRANHTLLIGPYEEGSIQRGPSTVLRGYQVDPNALIDLRELRYQWFDHILKGAKKPALLSDRVNYQMMGTNEWRHAPSLQAMSKGSLRFYLEANPAIDRNLLVQSRNPKGSFLPQTFDLEDRDDAQWPPPSELFTKNPLVSNGEMFISEPLQQAVEISGLFSAELDFRVNKMDMDLNVALYELLPSGDYVKLFDPSYEVRASYARDPAQRQLLKAGIRQQLALRSERFTSRKLQAGSRVVLVLGINKRPDRQINYGTGGDVSVESISNASVPLKIRWFNDSYIELPVQR